MVAPHIDAWEIRSLGLWPAIFGADGAMGQAARQGSPPGEACRPAIQHPTQVGVVGNPAKGKVVGLGFRAPAARPRGRVEEVGPALVWGCRLNVMAATAAAFRSTISGTRSGAEPCVR